jgi:hypothetical protein
MVAFDTLNEKPEDIFRFCSISLDWYHRIKCP